MKTGIYLVSNDLYANQLIALLNSFKVNWPSHPPICVIPYDQKSKEVQAICKKYDVSFYSNWEVLDKIDKYFTDLWMGCPKAIAAWSSRNKKIPFRLGMHRRFLGCLEQGLFDRFIYLDTDIYINKSLEVLFDLLNEYDIVAHDWQHKGPQHVFNLESPKLSSVLNGPLLDQIQCAGLIATKKTVFSNEEWSKLPQLIAEDQDVLHPWGPDQTLWNYAFNKYKKKFVNLVRSWPKDQISHDAQTYTKFQFRNGKLYQDDKEILYFHHIGVPAEEFNRICNGESPKHDFRYQEVFKYFRFLENP